MTITFPSAAHFLSHIQHYGGITLKSKQTLKVCDILTLRDPQIDAEFSSSIYEIVMHYLNQILLPLGKVLKQISEKACKPNSFEVGKDISLSFSHRTRLIAEQGTLYCKLSTFFQMMINTAMASVILGKDQKLTLLGEEISADHEGVNSCLKSILEVNSPEGYGACLFNNHGVVTLQAGTIRYPTPTIKQKKVTISCDRGLKIQIAAAKVFPSIKDFIHEMYCKHKIELLPFQMLKIKDTNMGALLQKVQCLESIFSPLESAFNQMFLSLSQTVDVSTMEEINFSFNEANELEFYSKAACTLNLVAKDKFITDLLDMGADLKLKCHQALNLLPGQRLWIYNLDMSELEWMNSEDEAEVFTGLFNLFNRRSTNDYKWDFFFTGDLNFSVINADQSVRNKAFLAISSNERIQLNLRTCSQTRK